MKKNWIMYALCGVLGVAVIVLYVLVLTNGCCKKGAGKQAESLVSEDSRLPLAFVNKDTLLKKYDLYIEMEEQMKLEENRSKSKIEKKAQELQKAQAEFLEKYENNAFLNRQRAEAAYNDLMKKQRELQEMDGQLSAELMKKQGELQQKLRATIDSVIRVYNEEKGYQFIIGNSAGVGILDDLLYADPSYDVTDEVLEMLNKKEE